LEGRGELAIGGVLTTTCLASGKVGVHGRAKLCGQRSASAVEHVASCFGAVHDPYLL